MSVAVKTVVYGVPAAGGTIGITYETTKETVGYTLNRDYGYEIKNLLDDAWSKIFEEFKKLTESLNDPEFKALKDEKDSKSKDDLKKLCLEKWDIVHSSIFEKNSHILNDTKTSCFISIGKAMGDNTYGTNENDLESDNLKNYSEGSDKPKLNDELQEYKNKLESSETEKQKSGKDGHAKWCESKSTEYYLGNNDTFKYFKEICKKKS